MLRTLLAKNNRNLSQNLIRSSIFRPASIRPLATQNYHRNLAFLATAKGNNNFGAAIGSNSKTIFFLIEVPFFTYLNIKSKFRKNLDLIFNVSFKFCLISNFEILNFEISLSDCN